MKLQKILLVLFCLLSFNSNQLFPQVVDLIINPSPLSIDLSESLVANYKLSFVITGNFSSSIILKISGTNLPDGLDCKFDTNPINPPYDTCIFSIGLKAKVQTGQYFIALEARNGSNFLGADTCWLNVFNDLANSWVIIDMRDICKCNWSMDKSDSPMLLDNEEAFWIFLQGDLYRYKDNQWTKFQYNLPYYRINSIAKDSNGVMWAGTTNGLIKFEEPYVTIFNRSNSGLPSDTVNQIVVDRNNVLWMATDKGLVSFSNGNWEREVINHKYPYNFTKSVMLDVDNNIWTGAYFSLIGKFNGSAWTLYNWWNFETGPTFAYYKKLLLDKDKNLWVNDTWCELVKYDFSTNTTKSFRDLFEDLNVNCFAFDNDDILWVGTARGGLMRYDGQNWKNYSQDNSGFPGSSINQIFVDKNNNKWFRMGYLLIGFGLLEGIVSVRESENIDDQELVLSPNPTSDYLKVCSELDEISDCDLRVLNLYGSEMIRLNFNGCKTINEELNISFLPPGAYNLIIRFGTQYWHHKFIKL